MAKNEVNEVELEELIKSFFKDKENVIPSELDELNEKQKKIMKFPFMQSKKLF